MVKGCCYAFGRSDLVEFAYRRVRSYHRLASTRLRVAPIGSPPGLSNLRVNHATDAIISASHFQRNGPLGCDGPFRRSTGSRVASISVLAALGTRSQNFSDFHRAVFARLSFLPLE